MEMKGKMRMNVLGASRYSFDGISGVKVFAQKDVDDSEDVVGIQVIELGGDLPLFDHFRGLRFPLDMDCDVEFGRGARGKASVRILSAQPVKSLTGKAASASSVAA
jgi:hypothetical protein